MSLLAQLRSRSKIAAAALLVACLGLSTNSPAKADEDRGKLGEELTAQQRFRDELGFRSDPAYVSAINASPNAYSATQAFGLTMTPAEATEIQQRVKVQDALPILEREVRARGWSRTFAGIYTDHESGGVVKLKFTREATPRLNKLKETFPYPERLQAANVQNSYASLKKVAAKVSMDASELMIAEEVPLTQHWVDIPRNKVIIGVSTVMPKTVRKLQARYGRQLIEVVEAPATQQDVHRPDGSTDDPGRNVIRDVRGGLAIRPARTGAWNCSSAFVGFNGQANYLLSAGHCEGGEKFQGVWPDGVNRSIGVVERERYGGPADVQAIRLAPGIVWRDDVYLWPGRTLVDVGSWQDNGDVDHPGDITCMTGMRHPGVERRQNCGIMTRKDYSPGAGFSPAFRCATYDSTYGDSGGAVYREYRSGIHALGIHNGRLCGNGPRTEKYYTHIGVAAIELGGIQVRR